LAGAWVDSSDCSKTVPKPYLLTRLGMQSERKQIPQVVENIGRR
jgi:hypothetical protein